MSRAHCSRYSQRVKADSQQAPDPKWPCKLWIFEHNGKNLKGLKHGSDMIRLASWVDHPGGKEDSGLNGGRTEGTTSTWEKLILVLVLVQSTVGG